MPGLTPNRGFTAHGSLAVAALRLSATSDPAGARSGYRGLKVVKPNIGLVRYMVESWRVARQNVEALFVLTTAPFSVSC